ncbi:MAG: hypothetical protein KKB50_04415 [Planctomycetes bacterium]|nr:hypothetical protein [Planctomycetota bacterium]
MPDTGIAQGAVGFTVSTGLDKDAQRRQTAAQHRALRHFPWLRQTTLRQGPTTLDLWSHHESEMSVHSSADGHLHVLIGSPVGRHAWDDVTSELDRRGDERFESPWNGRVVLLRIAPDGRSWALWNDWNGSIPVFHAAVGAGRCVSTLEPVVVAAADFTPDDFYLPGLVSLLVNGHYLGDWTLFAGMRTVLPDSIARWDECGFRSVRLGTVTPTDVNWGRAWAELVDEMYELSRAAMEAALAPHGAWVLPLSGGVDSRLVAAVGVDRGCELHAYTYGPATWDEVIYARQVAKALKTPWTRVDLGTNYLTRYSRMWADWFGSALHFHGMYQMPFLEHLRGAAPGPMLQGYLGDPLAGNHVAGLRATHDGGDCRAVAMHGDLRWSLDDLPGLLRLDATDAGAAVSAEIRREISEAPGARFQQLMLLDLWTRQRLFVYYQPMMYDYWRGVATPFFDRQYARFCFSLPEEALAGRKLQMDMIRRHYPALAAIGGTHRRTPLRPPLSWRLRAALEWRLPAALRVGPLREFNPTPNTLHPDCIRAAGEAAVWPIPEARAQLGEWFNLELIDEAIENAQRGDWTAVNRLEAVQTVALRVLCEQGVLC